MPTKSPRLNVTVTEEQHVLLLELGRLNSRSAASYLRDMVDQITPLLRAVVPMMQAAERETEISRDRAQSMLNEVMEAMTEAGLNVALPQSDNQPAPRAPLRNAASASERGRTTRGAGES